MTEYDLMQAAAGKLTALWPDRPVYTGTIPAGADGSFFLESTGSEPVSYTHLRAHET